MAYLTLVTSGPGFTSPMDPAAIARDTQAALVLTAQTMQTDKSTLGFYENIRIISDLTFITQLKPFLNSQDPIGTFSATYPHLVQYLSPSLLQDMSTCFDLYRQLLDLAQAAIKIDLTELRSLNITIDRIDIDPKSIQSLHKVAFKIRDLEMRKKLEYFGATPYQLTVADRFLNKCEAKLSTIERKFGIQREQYAAHPEEHYPGPIEEHIPAAEEHIPTPGEEQPYFTQQNFFPQQPQPTVFATNYGSNYYPQAPMPAVMPVQTVFSAPSSPWAAFQQFGSVVPIMNQNLSQADSYNRQFTDLNNRWDHFNEIMRAHDQSTGEHASLQQRNSTYLQTLWKAAWERDPSIQNLQILEGAANDYLVGIQAFVLEGHRSISCATAEIQLLKCLNNSIDDQIQTLNAACKEQKDFEILEVLNPVPVRSNRSHFLREQLNEFYGSTKQWEKLVADLDTLYATDISNLTQEETVSFYINLVDCRTEQYNLLKKCAISCEVQV